MGVIIMRILALIALVTALAIFGCISTSEKPAAQAEPNTSVEMPTPTIEGETTRENMTNISLEEVNLSADEYYKLADNLTFQYGESKDYYNTTVLAMVLVNKSLELEPNSTYAYLVRSIIWTKLGNWTNAYLDAKKAYELEPTNPDVLAQACIVSNDTSVAMRFCNKAISINPNVSWYYKNRAYVKGDNKDHQGGIEDINYAIMLDPNSTANYRARCYLKTFRRTYIKYSKEYRTALPDCEIYLKEHPFSWSTIMFTGLNKLMWKNATESLNDYARALELILEQERQTGMELRDDKNYVYGQIGSIKVGLKEYSEAVYYMDLAIKYADEEPYQNLTRDSNKTGGMFIGTVMGIPKDSWGAWNHYWRGVAKYRLGDIEGARVDFNRSNELDRRYDDFIEMRGSLESPGLAPYIEIRYYQD